MIIINFSHPLTAEHLTQVEVLTGQAVTRVIDAPAQFDNGQSFAPQVEHLLDNCGLSARDWQTLPILVVLPAHNVIAATLLAELHGRSGHFPAVLRLCPKTEGLVTHFEVAEVINLEAVRERGRKKR